MRHHGHHHGWVEGPGGAAGHHRRFRGPPWMHGSYDFARGPITPIARYIRARLHRRLFMLLGFSILFSVVISWAVLTLTSDRGAFGEVRTGLRRFATEQFAAAWDDPARRESLAASVAANLRFPVELRDADGTLLQAFGEACEDPALTAPIQSPAGTTGQVRLCWPTRAHANPWMPVLPLAIVGLGLWLIAGKFSRRVSRPLSELSRVAQEIGEGNLAARASLHCHGYDEVGIVALSVNEMAGRIEKQLADQRELLAAVSHELRTPLARMRLLSELLRDAGGDPSRLDELEREVVEMDALVGELLASARVDFSALTRRTVDARDLATRALERANLPATLLSVEPPDVPAGFDADPTLVARALANLVDNANKHGGGLVALKVTLDPSTVRFEAEDGGPGFPAGSEANVFEPFQPTADGRERTGGSLGLGLALVRRIAAAHGGEAYAKNRPGGGAIVGVRLPRAAPVPKRHERAEA